MARSKDRKEANPGKVRAMLGDRALILRTLTSIVTALIVATVMATLVAGRGPLIKQASELRGTRLSVAFEWPPLAGRSTSRTASGEPATWMNAEQRRELEGLALKLLSGDPFDADSLQRTHDALHATGWFADGPWLKRYSNGLVLISGKWRVPVAAVRIGETDRLVSAGGELLAPSYPRDRTGLRVIVGAGAAPEQLGEPFEGGQVQAGLALLAFLRPLPGFEQIDAIDVSDVPGNKRLSVLTKTGGRILWGGTPGQFHPGQADANAKRERLAAVYQQFGQLDAGRRVLDVRPQDGVYLQDDGYIARNTTVRR